MTTYAMKKLKNLKMSLFVFLAGVSGETRTRKIGDEPNGKN
jgi:hypothetical protein